MFPVFWCPKLKLLRNGMKIKLKYKLTIWIQFISMSGSGLYFLVKIHLDFLLRNTGARLNLKQILNHCITMLNTRLVPYYDLILIFPLLNVMPSTVRIWITNWYEYRPGGNEQSGCYSGHGLNNKLIDMLWAH